MAVVVSAPTGQGYSCKFGLKTFRSVKLCYTSLPFESLGVENSSRSARVNVEE